jgi:HemY protein
MRLLLVALLAMALTGAAVQWALHEPGYVLLAWGHWSAELSLVLFGVILIIAFVLLYLLLRFLTRVWIAPSDIAVRLHRSRAERARRRLIRGLLDFAEGRWSHAERLLIRGAAHSETPLLNYLAAAHAAQRLQAYDRRDVYLRRAIESDPQAKVAVELSQAQLQLDHQQTEQALATLRHLREIAPDHAYVMRLLGKLYLELKDWGELERLLPRLRRSALISSERYQELETRIIHGLFDHARERNELNSLKSAWEALPRKSRQRPELLALYCEHLAALGEPAQAERLLARALNGQWNEELAQRYGRVRGDDPAQQLRRAETWLDSHPHSATLLLSLARLSAAAQLWGKSRSYYEASLAEQANASAYFELGELLMRLEEGDAAAECYRKGLRLSVEGHAEALEGPRLNRSAPLPPPDRRPDVSGAEDAYTV